MKKTNCSFFPFFDFVVEVLHFLRFLRFFRECLNAGAVPSYKMNNIGTVPTFKMHNVGTVPMFKMHNKNLWYFFRWNLDCVAKTNDRSLHQFFYWSYLGLSFYACLPLFNQVSIVLIRNTLFRKCLSQNLFLVPVIGYWDVDLIILSIFSIKVQFSVPLFCPQT